MNKLLANILKMILIIGVLGLMACSEKAPPAPASKVVKKKIVVPAAPTTQTTSNELAAQATPPVPEAVAQPSEESSVPAKSAKAAKTPAAEGSGSEPLTAEMPVAAADGEVGAAVTQPENSSGHAPQDVAAAVDTGQPAVSAQTEGAYNARGRINPFAPLFKDQGPPEVAADTSKGKRLKRDPQTPLEKVALSQLKLTAIIRSSAINRALVSDATGKGYVVQPGTYIGLNSGKVVQIERDRIVIEEEYEDLAGEFKIHNSELKLQKPAGEF